MFPLIERADQARIVDISRGELQIFLQSLHTRMLQQFDVLPPDAYTDQQIQLFDGWGKTTYDMTKPHVIPVNKAHVSVTIGKEKFGILPRLGRTKPSFLIDCLAITKDNASSHSEQYLLTEDGYLERVTADGRDTESIPDAYFLDAVELMHQVVDRTYESKPTPGPFTPRPPVGGKR
ncbi:hypothetical protein A2363_04180 [Candidatus Gottesmanbacteria bacterium RIFOXYB1_FULL_47_11]|uniref:Uncharacterized protein n=1 Tax=Candidatus Gottesmanbacteria bacterium RIFOXYB1_FULL_47_11 TaxID=1798401 RepID=A0A1F6BGP7_9BACT|nr:MAG: hypothetical protein A2363_04180 [Candidatus Gottesmanbacteria bacterium RIFOXYB1_FULL_47_11]